MTAPVSAALTTDARCRQTVLLVQSRLRRASEALRVDASPAAVQASQQAMDDAERALGALVHDPWEPSVGPVREAREILSSHLLAATACESAAVAPTVTAGVLRRGADTAHRVLGRLGYGSESDRSG